MLQAARRTLPRNCCAPTLYPRLSAALVGATASPCPTGATMTSAGPVTAVGNGGKPEPRTNFLTDPFTSRDLFGVVRGRCKACDQCGKYLKATAEYTVSPLDKGRKHPDNDIRLTDCSRCRCPAGEHEVMEHEHAKEQGNDAFALGQFDTAVVHYSKALQLNPSDATLWSNRAAAYLAKGWYAQALHDAEHALSIRPDWGKAWGRKGAALAALGRHSGAEEAFARAVALDPGNAVLQQGLGEVQKAQQRQAREQQQQQQPAGAAAGVQHRGWSTAATQPGVCGRVSTGAPPPQRGPVPSPHRAEKTPPRRRASINGWPSPSTDSYYTAGSSTSSRASAEPRGSQASGRGRVLPAGISANGSDGGSSSYGTSEVRSGLRGGKGGMSPWAPKMGMAVEGGAARAGPQPAPHSISRSPAAPMAGPHVSSPKRAQGCITPQPSIPGAQATPPSPPPSHAWSAAAAVGSKVDIGQSTALPAHLPAALALQWGQLEGKVGRVAAEVQTLQQQMQEFSTALAALFPAASEKGAGTGLSAATGVGGQHGSSNTAAWMTRHANTLGKAAAGGPGRCQNGSPRGSASRGDSSAPTLDGHLPEVRASQEVREEKEKEEEAAGAAQHGQSAAAGPRQRPPSGLGLHMGTPSTAGHRSTLGCQLTKREPGTCCPHKAAAPYAAVPESPAMAATDNSAAELASASALLASDSSAASLPGWACSAGRHGKPALLGEGLAGGTSSTSMELASGDFGTAGGPAASPAAGSSPGSGHSQGRQGSSLTQEGSTDALSPLGIHSGSSRDATSPASLGGLFSSSAGATFAGEGSAATLGSPPSSPKGEPSWVAELLAANTARGSSSGGSSGGSHRGGTAGSTPEVLSPAPPQGRAGLAALPKAGSAAAGPWQAGAPGPPKHVNKRGSSQASSGAGSSNSGGEGSESDLSADGDSNGDSSSSSWEEWLHGVEEARRKLAAGAGGMQPPIRGNRRAPRADTAGGGGGISNVSFAALQSLVDVAASAVQWKKDPQGVVRVGCKLCGPRQCPAYSPFTLEQLVTAGWAEAEGSPARLLAGDVSKLSTAQRLCASCGCDCDEHENEGEASIREARELRARLREQRLARLREEEEAARAAAQAGQGPALHAIQVDNVEVRRARMAAALARKAAADEAGEQLQASDCDVLTQSKRGNCGACRACPGFCILFRSGDANDPEVMFYCSVCGCRSDVHEVDKAWLQQEEARRQAAEAAAQRAKQAQQAAAQQYNQLAREEEEAYTALGLPLGTDAKSIARAYKRLALQLHPDKQQQGVAAGSAGVAAAAAAAQERFMAVAAAYKFLTERRG